MSKSISLLYARVNKKTLFLILLGVAIALPSMVLGATLSGMASSVDTAISAVGGSIVFIGWVVTGILWLTSGGSPEKTGTAKKAVVACTIGTILVILAGASTAIMGVIRNAFGL